MNYKEFQSAINQNDVDTLWDSIQDVPEKASNENWKYLLKRENKKIPFKWFLYKMAESKGFDLDFSSDYETRNKFCTAFNFEIEEELVYDKSELDKFRSFYESKVQSKQNFQYFVDYSYKVLLDVGINPYNIRMAITHSNEAMVVIGMRAVLIYSNDKIGLIIENEVLSKYPDLVYDLDYDYKGEDNVCLICFKQILNELPIEILENNLKAIKTEYENIKNTPRAKWNVEAKTTNSTLKHILFNRKNVESFMKNNQEFQMEYFDLDNILKYKILINERYQSKSEASKIFKDTRTKIYYLAEILSKKLNVKLINNYKERINKQAGQGNSYHNYKDYIVVGFLPDNLKFLEDNVFIKISFGFWKPVPEFHYQVDVNYKKSDNSYKKDRDFFLNLNPLWLPINDSFPTNWKDLLERTSENFRKIMDNLIEHFNMNNIKEEFAEWLISKPKPNYYDNDKTKILSKLNDFNNFFDFNIYLCSNTNYEEIISKISNVIYSKNEDNDFFIYSKSEQNHIPKGILGKENYFKFLKEKFNANNQTIVIEQPKLKNMPLNQILYGAPGTGKTYLTKKLAVEIIEGKKFGNGSIERKEINDKYKSYIESKQIRFTTFHQSLSYEDFIEGIKPKMNGSDKEIEYEVKDGIFKSICKDATQQKQSNNFEEAYAKFIEDVSEIGTIELKSLIQQKPFDVRINSNQNCVAIPHTETKTNMVITKKMVEEYVINDKIIDWKTYTTAIGEHLKKQYQVEVESIDNQNKNYVLIIDEINRGNVSSIFGELITLLEEDKRAGKDETIEVTLPYSQKDFSVPKNVYIIGTMNTADRSVEALDTALRRRFSFIEMQPKPELLAEVEYNEINLTEILYTLNQRIEFLIDKDHQIGHSYLFKVKNFTDLVYVFRDKIIPLLEEYFYGDFGKIGLVLGERFIKPKAVTSSNILAHNFKYNTDLLEEKELFEFTSYKDWNIDTFKSIYQKITESEQE